MQTDLEFQQVLLKVQEALTVDEVKDLVFLCFELLSLKDLSTVSSAGQLFTLLGNKDLLSREDPSLVLELLRILKRNSLIRSLTSEEVIPTNGTKYSQLISTYRQFLYELSESICEQDLKNIKFLLLKTLSRKKLEDTTLLQLFLELEKEGLLDENNLDFLEKIIAPINPSLGKRIIQYKTESCKIDVVKDQVNRLNLTEGAAAASRDQSQNSLIENIQQYEMKGDKRGVCLIINNYDFKKCSLRDRDGTDIDKKSLEVVFEWLGFEVVTEQNCDRHQILQVLRDLAARDHTSADCVVCCVLSHGKIEGILGVDGKIVTYRELIETLSPSQCPSLFEKPKLFFIQACRGANDQPAALPQIFPDDEVMPVSDAAVPRDSIPEMADYLFAMSTVPNYVSYRDKDHGTWFIQSLCDSLKMQVPRGIDLLSILTQVNSDVSKKTDKSGLKKQMPQPEFTLTKRVVFPPPKTHTP
ncbi:caspase-8 [Carassius gibelio]|uniref:caspase-8 n=1 Tax=Carassius gibelio TaxID=101364 RepID=UPI0022784679|nr:caspase-8 [Carassius gibelio]